MLHNKAYIIPCSLILPRVALTTPSALCHTTHIPFQDHLVQPCHVCRLHELDASVCALRLPQAFHALLPQLCAEQEGVRFGTQQALKNLIHDCLDEGTVNTAVSRSSMGSSAMPPAHNIVVAVANTLTVRYQDGWINALSGVIPLRCIITACGPRWQCLPNL